MTARSFPDATARPWVVYRAKLSIGAEVVVDLDGGYRTVVAECGEADDAALIVAAVNERDALQAEVARLREALTRTVAFVDATADVLAGFGATTSTVTKLREVAAEARAALVKP